MQACPSSQSVALPVEPAAQSSANPSEQQNQIARLRATLAEGLPALPSYVFELNSLLSASPVDLRKVGEVIRRDPSLAAQVVRMCNSTLIGVREEVSSIEHAVMLLGTERLRTLVLTISLVEYVGSHLAASVVQSFWQHSFMTAILSERTARWTAYSRPEQAYLAGLLHDIGTLPLLTIASRNLSGPGAPAWFGASESVEAEQKHFGLSHCDVGRWIGISWNFAPALIDVFQNHHNPQGADRDSHLVGAVAVADRLCQKRGVRLGGESPQLCPADPQQFDTAIQECLPSLGAEDRLWLAEALETESLHLVQMLEVGNPGLFGRASVSP